MLAASSCASGSARGRAFGAPRNYVLVHGAWHGGWCWWKVRPLIEAAGMRVLTPTLTGLGERGHLIDPAPSLDTHIEDVARVLEYEDLRDVVLVGHSYGGMVITGVADRLRDRIARLVYLDAAVPSDGQTIVTQKPGITAAEIAATEAALRELAPDGRRMIVLPIATFGLLNLSREEAAFIERRLTPHPLRTWFDPIRLPNGGGEGLPRVYIHCTSPVLEQSSFPAHAARIKNDPTWRYVELATGHDAMISAPVETAAEILRD